jgi:hypothetical protein
MRAHVIENGVVVNTVEVESLGVLPGLVAAQGNEGIGWLYDGHVHSPRLRRRRRLSRSPSPCARRGWRCTPVALLGSVQPAIDAP